MWQVKDKGSFAKFTLNQTEFTLDQTEFTLAGRAEQNLGIFMGTLGG